MGKRRREEIYNCWEIDASYRSNAIPETIDRKIRIPDEFEQIYIKKETRH